MWRELNAGNHVLLLIDSQGDSAYFDRRLEDIAAWFSPITTRRYGSLDFLMSNNTYLCVRRLLTLPVSRPPSNVKVMVL